MSDDNPDGPGISEQDRARSIIEEFLRDPALSGLKKDVRRAQALLKSKNISMTQARIRKLMNEYTELQTKGESFAGHWPRMYPSAIWFADLLETKYKQPAYLFTMIDLYSRYAIVLPLSGKAATKTAAQFEDALTFLEKQGIPKPQAMITDDGTEFKGAFRKAAEAHGIPLNQVNAKRHHGALSVIDRFHRTLRELYRRYADIYGEGKLLKGMKTILSGYNNSYHAGIKAVPVKAIVETPQTMEHDAWPAAKVSVGDYVRIKVPLSMYQKASAILRLEPEVYRVIRRINEKLYLVSANPGGEATADEPLVVSLFSVSRVNGFRSLKTDKLPASVLEAETASAGPEPAEPELKNKKARMAERELETDLVPEHIQPRTSKRERAAKRDYKAMALGWE